MPTNKDMKQYLTKTLSLHLVLDQGWEQAGEWVNITRILGRYSRISLTVGDSFTYNKRWDQWETTAIAVLGPENVEAAAGLNAHGEDGDTLVEQGGRLVLTFTASVERASVPEGYGIHYR